MKRNVKYSAFFQAMFIVLGSCISQMGAVNAAARIDDSKRAGVVVRSLAELEAKAASHPRHRTDLFEAQSAGEVVEILKGVRKEDLAAYLKIKDSGGGFMYRGSNALQANCMFAKPEVVEAILNAVPEAERAAFLKIQNDDGRTALQMANTTVSSNSSKCVDIILAAVSEAEIGSIINVQNTQGNTVLHELLSVLRLSFDHEEEDVPVICRNNIITLLAQPGVDIHIRNTQGETARDINPTAFDSCATAANVKITAKNAERRAQRDRMRQVLVAQGMIVDLAELSSQYTEPDQPLIPVGAVAPAAPVGAAVPAVPAIGDGE